MQSSLLAFSHSPLSRPSSTSSSPVSDLCVRHMEIKENDEERNKKRTKEKECEKEIKRSGVGIQPTTNIITVIIIRCYSYSLMKRESAGELPIRSQSSFIHSFFLLHILIYFFLLKSTIILVFVRFRSCLT